MINHLGLITSNYCQNKCTYCYRGEQIPKMMSLETAIKSIQEVIDTGTKQLRLTFLGGEPLIMYKKLIKPLLEYSHNFSIPISFILCTNGQLLNKEILNFLNNYDVHIALSLDGIKEAHDANRITKTNKPTWDIVMDKVPLLLEYFPKAHIQATFNSKTISMLYESYLFHESLGFKQWYFAPDIYSDWNLRALQSLSQQLDKLVRYYLTSPNSPNFSLIDEYLKGENKTGNPRFKKEEHNILVEPNGQYKISRLSATVVSQDLDSEFYISSLNNIDSFFSTYGETIDQDFYAQNVIEICSTCPANDLCITPHNAKNNFTKLISLQQPDIQCYQKRLIYLTIERYKYLNERIL